MQCCGNCFQDIGLSNKIDESSSGSGKCPTCKSTNQKLIDVVELRDYFELLVGIYNEDENGKLLVQWFKDDWALFVGGSLEDTNDANALLAEVLDDGEIIRKKFVPSAQWRTDRQIKWEELRTELMHENRFFPQTNFDQKRLQELLNSLIIRVEQLSCSWFRARITKNARTYSNNEMGAPPKKLASSGRANPVGIPYLYIASKLKTALSEVRPHPGEKVCVASLQVDEGLKIADLRQPRKSISPFLLGDEDELGALREDISFLEKLGNELTNPVSPSTASIEYIPSQYLCEFIKKIGFDGVAYRSSMSSGVNLALFYSDKAQIGEVKVRIIESVTVESSECS